MSESWVYIIKVGSLFFGLFAGIWLLKRAGRWFGPAIKMIGVKPWK